MEQDDLGQRIHHTSLLPAHMDDHDEELDDVNITQNVEDNMYQSEITLQSYHQPGSAN